jgi:hypothetical protein
VKRTIPIFILCALFLGGCHIAAEKDEQGYLGPGATWTRVEGIGLDNNTVALVTGQQPTTKPSGWITRIDYMKAGDAPEGVVSTNVKHIFGMDGIQTPFTRQPAVNAVVREGGRKSEVTAEGVGLKQEAKKGLGVTELLWWLGGSLLLIGLILGVVYYYVPAARPIISGLISKLPGFGHKETPNDQD